jgi:hypothetical protein
VALQLRRAVGGNPKGITLRQLRALVRRSVA